MVKFLFKNAEIWSVIDVIGTEFFYFCDLFFLLNLLKILSEIEGKIKRKNRKSTQLTSSWDLFDLLSSYYQNLPDPHGLFYQVLFFCKLFPWKKKTTVGKQQ